MTGTWQQGDHIEVTIGEHKDLTVRIPRVAHDDLIRIIGTFFAKGDAEIARETKTLLGESREITLTLTTKRDE